MDDAQRLALHRLADTWLRQLTVARTQSGEAVADLAGDFRDVVSAVDRLTVWFTLPGDVPVDSAGGAGHAARPACGDIAADARRIRDAIDRILARFQFQDRADQILSHVTDSIRALCDRLATAGADPGEAAVIDERFLPGRAARRD